MTTWSTAQHEVVESEIAAAYHDGLVAGVALAREAFTKAIDEALAGPHGFGLERAGVSPSGVESIRRMLHGLVVTR